jgi:succinate dehydrogenase / fumarate reductase cytochrome b subunit
MARLGRIYRTSIGAKAVVAVTGVLLFFFLIGHLSGNLLVFRGPEAINAYAEFLHSKPALVWGARIGLLAIFLIHVWTTAKLTLQNSAARPVGYRHESTVQATVASRYMIHTGILVGAFVVFHLLHFTVQAIDTGGMGMVDAEGRKDVYAMVIAGFSKPVIALGYVVAMIVLGFHLYHAVKSFFQTLGWRHTTSDRVVNVVAPALAVLIAAGNILIPLLILFGVRPQ